MTAALQHHLLPSSGSHAVREPRWALAGATLIAAALCTSACAHDTWFHLAKRQPESGLLALELGSGARYPKNEGAIPGSHVIHAGCVDDKGVDSALLPRSEDGILELRARVGDARSAACWLELTPIDFTLTPELVQVYFDDIRAPQSVRDYWAAQRKAGIGWHEIYRKFVRTEVPVPGGGPASSVAALRQVRGFPLELVPAGDAPVRARLATDYLALSGGKPVAGLPVEFVSNRSPLGIWTQSDAQGRIRLALPFPGEWLLRATALDPPASPREAWHSRFATLTVQVE